MCWVRSDGDACAGRAGGGGGGVRDDNVLKDTALLAVAKRAAVWRDGASARPKRVPLRGSMALAGWLVLVSAAVSALPATPPRSAHAAAPPATPATPPAAALRPPPATPPSLPHSAALAAASPPPTGASVAAALTALEANKDTDEEAEVEAADGVPPASAMHSLPGVADVLPLDLDALWPFNDSFHLSHLDEIDQPHGEGNGVSGEAGGAGGGERAAADASALDNGPVFDADLVTNVTAQLGGPAFLRCRVRNLGERVVSWIRRRDWHILTSGVFTYTNDERFQVVHFEGSDEWTLHIKYVQKRDNGTYECQVATGGGVISHYFNLHVMVPAAFILGSGEYHIGEGSTISLVCIIENSPSPPQYVFWYHNDNMINYESVRGGVTVSTEPGPKTHSRLLIHQATRADSGNYTCRAPNTEDDTIYVFVSQGDNTAAIQRQSSAASGVLYASTRGAWKMAATVIEVSARIFAGDILLGVLISLCVR